MSDPLTPRIACELVSHEAIVPSAYKDNATPPNWTWGIGATDASGHYVRRYIGKPQPIVKCIEVYLWLLRTHYLPAVLRAFGNHQPTEAQLGAALSFHYNTGEIESTNWLRLFLRGDVAEARAFLETHYLNGGDLKGRRMAEAALFFDGKWSNDGTALVYDVNPATYAPCHPHRVEIASVVQQVMAGTA